MSTVFSRAPVAHVPTSSRCRPRAPRATWLLAGLIGALLVSTAALATAAELGSDLAGVLAEARARNPELAAMRAEADAAVQRVQPAGALPDPVLRVELENITNHGTDAPPSVLPSKVGDTKYTLMQALPLWGKRDLRRDVAVADADRASALAGAGWNELAARIKAAYARYYLAAGSERITREVMELLGRLEQIAQARYAGGLVAQQDVIRAQVEKTSVQAELIGLDADRRQSRVRLNALMGREPAAPLADPQALRALPAATVLDAPSLAQRARAANPALAAENARLRSAQGTRDLALKNRYPDVNVGVVPTQSGTRITSWGLMFEVNIPLQQDARRSQEREAEAMVSAQRARADAASSQLLGELGENLAALDAARRSQVLAAQQLAPQSELAFRSAVAAYENGKVDFATLLDAQRQIRKARQDQLKAEVEAQMRLAEIERIVGEEL